MNKAITGIANARHDGSYQHSRAYFSGHRISRAASSVDEGRLIQKNFLGRIIGGRIEVREHVVLLIERWDQIDTKAIVQR